MPALGATVQTSLNTDVFELAYQGPDVENGSMSANEVIEVVTGVNRAFSILAHERDLGDQYELRLKDVDHASFHLLFEAIAYVKTNPVAATVEIAGAGLAWKAITDTVSGAYKVITDLGALISAKKKTKGERVARIPAEFTDGEVQLSTPDGAFVLTRDQYELLLSQRVDRQLSQMVSPLAPKRIDRFQMLRSEVELATVDANQRDYFDYREVLEGQSTEGTEIIGTLNSLTKTSLRGTFYTMDGIHVPYRYTGGDIAQLLRGFATREPLRVRGRIRYGVDGLPTSVEVQEMEPIQRTFF